ncbi:hypothetical protein [Nostoc sp.]|uniref:hypothetical protein n=1 Tax=Nostoc sp. TaxID=1180 RepID=UPI002FFA3CF2
MHHNITLPVKLDINSFYWAVVSSSDACGGLRLRNRKSSTDCYGEGDFGKNLFHCNRSNTY